MSFRKYKLPNQQDGQVYLTSHRICYVDKADPRKQSVALDLKEVERYEFYVGVALRNPQKASRQLLTELIPGWIPQVIRKGHADPQDDETLVPAAPIPGTGIHAIEERQRISPSAIRQPPPAPDI